MLHFAMVSIVIAIASEAFGAQKLTHKNAIGPLTKRVMSTPPAPNGTLDGIARFHVPYHVSIQAGRHDFQHICAGTIIDESFVLTAAHCFHKIHNPKDITVVVGSNRLSTKKGMRYGVAQIIVHKYFEPLMGRDIALLKIEPKLKLEGKLVDKINYKVNSALEGNVDAYMIGWGRKKSGVEKKLELVSFRTISTSKCRKQGFIYVSSTEVCAISYKGRGACDGDSGGPLVNTAFNLQLGLLSYGRKPCKKGKIYAFTRLYPLIGWIEENMRKFR